MSTKTSFHEYYVVVNPRDTETDITHSLLILNYSKLKVKQKNRVTQNAISVNVQIRVLERFVFVSSGLGPASCYALFQ